MIESRYLMFPSDHSIMYQVSYCCIHEQKESSESIYCIFLLLVAGHKYLQYIMFKYTAVHRTPNRELTLNCSVLIHLEDRYVSAMSFSTVSLGPCLSCLSVRSQSQFTTQLTLLEPEYCPTSFPVRIARGSVSGQLAPVLE